jgi:hypothetical protein
MWGVFGGRGAWTQEKWGQRDFPGDALPPARFAQNVKIMFRGCRDSAIPAMR